MRVLAFDIETGSADSLFKHRDYRFVRLCGWRWIGCPDPVEISTDPADLIAVIQEADAVTAHKGAAFDVLVLAAEEGLDYESTCRKLWDTLLVERHLDPVAARGAQANGYYNLDITAQRYGLAGKSAVDFQGKREIVRRIQGDKAADRLKPGKETSFPVLKLLKDLYGDYHLIAQDDPDYRTYLEYDVLAQEGVFLKQSSRMAAEPPSSRQYMRREHYVAAATGRVALEAVRMDVDLIRARHEAGLARVEVSKAKLADQFGMPREGKKPHTTKQGRAAFREALLATGISERALEKNWPTGAGGVLLMGKDVLNPMIDVFENSKPEAAELCRTILAMNGERTIYGTALTHLKGDRAHLEFTAGQGSGRWSNWITVMGKRGGKHVERAIVLPDSDDEVLVAIDADQVDARVIAAECQDPEYMKLFLPGRDLHSEVAFRVWSDPRQHGPKCHREARPDCCGVELKCHCERRTSAKVSGHGFSYGLGPRGMSIQQGVPIEDCKRFIDGFIEAFPVLNEWKEMIRIMAGAVGFDEEVPENDSYRILHTWAGRPVRVERKRAYTQATAQLGQGGTRDVMAEAMLKLSPERRRRIRALIHDEFVFSLPRDGAEKEAQAIAESMAFDLRGVDITFGVSPVGNNWAECYA